MALITDLNDNYVLPSCVLSECSSLLLLRLVLGPVHVEARGVPSMEIKSSLGIRYKVEYIIRNIGCDRKRERLS